MENKPKFWQTNQNSDKQNKMLTNNPILKSLEAGALLIALNK